MLACNTWFSIHVLEPCLIFLFSVRVVVHALFEIFFTEVFVLT